MTVNESLHILEPVLGNVQTLVSSLEWALGGIFGLYLVFFIVRYFHDRRNKILLQSIDNHIKDLERTVKYLNKTVTKIEKLEEKRVTRKKKK